MVCCTLIAGLLALVLFPAAAWRPSPLAWRPHGIAAQRPAMRSGRINSFRHAVAGLSFALRNEPNMRIHACASMLVLVLGLWFGLDLSEWRWLIVAIILVVATEALNTAIEQCCNAIGEGFHPAIKAAKDVAAGAVLASAIGAGLIGITIFAPYLPTMRAHSPICGEEALDVLRRPSPGRSL